MATDLGLLGFDDPKTLGLLSLGLRLMSTPGKFGTALGQSGLGALGDMQAANAQQEDRKRRALQDQMMQMQLEQQRKQQERAAAVESAYRQAFRSPAQQALAGGGGPTVANAAKLSGLQPSIDQGALIQGLMQADPMTAAGMLQDKPEYKVVGGSLVKIGRGGVSEAYREPTKPDKPTTDMQNYAEAVKGGYLGSFDEWLLRNKKASATNVSVNTTKPLMNTLAEGLGKQVDSEFGAAKAAVNTIDGARKLSGLVASGKLVTGPGADWRIAARQVGETLGLTGKDNAETLAKTRSAIQQLANFELEAAQGMKGQGQITEAEREILARAAAGKITYTGPELSALATALEQRARKRISAHNDNVRRLGQMPEGANLVPFYTVNEPPAASIDDLVKKYGSR